MPKDDIQVNSRAEEHFARHKRHVHHEYLKERDRRWGLGGVTAGVLFGGDITNRTARKRYYGPEEKVHYLLESLNMGGEIRPEVLRGGLVRRPSNVEANSLNTIHPAIAAQVGMNVNAPVPFALRYDPVTGASFLSYQPSAPIDPSLPDTFERAYEYDEDLDEEEGISLFPMPTWQDFLSGTCAGVSITLVGHPFDTIKVRLQTQDMIPGRQAAFNGVIDCTTQTIRKEGWLALYKGMEGPLLTVPILNAIVFAAYEQGLSFFRQREAENQGVDAIDAKLGMNQIALAGGWAGFVNTAIVGPVELVKSRLQTQYDTVASKQKFGGPWDVAKSIVQKKGLRGLFLGTNITIMREVPAYMSQFWTYEAIKRLLTPRDGTPDDIGPISLMMAGGLAGMMAWVASYPQDVIKSRLQIQSDDGARRYLPHKRFWFDGGIINCAKSVWRERGWRGFTTGFGACVARALPANAAGFLTYEMVSKQLNPPSTVDDDL